MQRKWWILAIVVIVLVCICVVIVVGAVGMGFIFTGAPTQAGDNFMAALRDGNYQAAYDLMVPELQDNIGTIADFKAQFEEGGVTVQSWTFNQRSTSGNTAELSGSFTTEDGEEGSVYLKLTKQDDTWLLYEYSLKL